MHNNKFDIYEPSEGHFERFKNRLEVTSVAPKVKKVHYTKWYLMAASLALLVSLWYNFKPNQTGYDLADVSPEMKETQNYFVNAIQTEIKQINLQKDEANELMINNALERVQDLEIAYNNLKIELEKSGFDKRIINAMIFNFQQRIEILQDLINQLNNFKNSKDETHIQNYV